MDENERIRVMVVDDHAIVRSGLASLLQAFPDMLFVGEAANGTEALARIAELQPQVVLMDMVMPGMDGIEATRRLSQQHPDVRVVMLTSFDDTEQVQAALQAGAIGYLLKNADVMEVLQAIRAAMQGEPTLSPDITRALIHANRNPAPDFGLTERELEVLQLLAQGMRNAQIARRLSLSLSTVKFHVSAILRKLEVENRTEAVTLALQHQLVHPPD